MANLLLKAAQQLVEHGSENYDLFKKFYVYEVIYSSLKKRQRDEREEDLWKEVERAFPVLVTEIYNLLCATYQLWLN